MPATYKLGFSGNSYYNTPMDHRISTHTVREEGDVVLIQLFGALEAEQFQQLLDIIDGVIARHGRYGTLIDTRRMSHMSPETRRLATQYHGASLCYGNAIVGDGFATRVVMTMAWRAIQLLNSQRFPAAFLKDEADARTWLKSRREASRGG